MAAEVFGNVLAFAIGIVGGRLQDTCAALEGALVMAIRVFNVYQQGVAGLS